MVGAGTLLRWRGPGSPGALDRSDHRALHAPGRPVADRERERLPRLALHPVGLQRPGRHGVHSSGIADRHHLRCLRPHRAPDALCPRRLHLRASGRVWCRGLPLRRGNQPDPQLLQADRRRPGEALPALRARRRTRGVRERCGAARGPQAVLDLRNGRRRDQQRGRWQRDRDRGRCDRRCLAWRSRGRGRLGGARFPCGSAPLRRPAARGAHGQHRVDLSFAA